MTVYFAPRSNYTGFLNDLGRGAAGIVTNLIGQQVAGMFDRANKAREVEAARAVMGALGNTAGMNEEQMLGSLLSNPQWGKLSANNQKQLMYLAGLRGKNYGGDMYRRGVIGQGGTNAQADTVIGAQLLGLRDGNVGKTIDWTHPKFEIQLIDQGDQYTLGQINPYRPGGIVSSSRQTFDKAVSPDAQLTADVAREGYRNAIDVARLKNAGLVNAAQAKAGGGQVIPDLEWLIKHREGLVTQRDGATPGSPAFMALSGELAGIDKYLQNIYGYGQYIPQQDAAPQTISQAEINRVAREIMDTARGKNQDVSMEDALRIAEEQLRNA